MIRSIPGDLERSTGMHFPDLWYFESVLRSWINANVSMGSQCSLVPTGTTKWVVPGLVVYNVNADPLPAMNRTVTLSLRNVSMRRHLVEFAATAAANLVQTLALQSESELQSGQVYSAW